MARRTEVMERPAPERTAPPVRPPRRKRMVGWFAPGLLARTGLKSFLANAIGKQADRRVLDALAVPGPGATDFSVDAEGRPREELWLDYVSDLGDGWDSTYAVALAVAREKLTLTDARGREYETRGGEVLVFGGDEVYPTPSIREYDERTVTPWASALRGQRPKPHLFALPGNHDWYDGLVSFTRLFCQGRRLPAWQTHQRRSYFAVKLPHGWWLLGTDMQLEADLDEPQVRYFQEIRKQMGPEDRVILCLAEPAWLLEQVRPLEGRGRGYLDNNLEFLQRQVLGRGVSVFLAGDLHHYRRHANEEGRQKIIAGGGGAFLHPTHAPGTQEALPDGFTQRACYPSAEESRRLTWRNLAFLGRNARFGLVTGLLYALLAWPLLNAWGAVLPGGLGAALGQALLEPVVLAVGALLVLALVAFADGRLGRWRAVAGAVHGLAHALAAVLLAWGVAGLAGAATGGARELAGLLLVFAGGFVVGPTLMGLYLLVSLNGLGVHANEAFSALACPDWKNFVRMRIDARGRLWLYPVGIRRVPRAWRPGATAREPEWVADPADREATPPMLIEPPIVVPGGGRGPSSPPAGGG